MTTFHAKAYNYAKNGINYKEPKAKRATSISVFDLVNSSTHMLWSNPFYKIYSLGNISLSLSLT